MVLMRYRRCGKMRMRLLSNADVRRGVGLVAHAPSLLKQTQRRLTGRSQGFGRRLSYFRYENPRTGLSAATSVHSCRSPAATSLAQVQTGSLW